MNHSSNSRQRRSRIRPAPDVLEDRMVLSAGEGSTFAIMPGTVSGPGMVSSVSFKLDPSVFSSPARGGRVVVGIDITPAVANTSGTTATVDAAARDRLGKRRVRAHHPRDPCKV